MSIVYLVSFERVACASHSLHNRGKYLHIVNINDRGYIWVGTYIPYARLYPIFISSLGWRHMTWVLRLFVLPGSRQFVHKLMLANNNESIKALSVLPTSVLRIYPVTQTKAKTRSMYPELCTQFVFCYILLWVDTDRLKLYIHYNDVILGSIASPIISSQVFTQLFIQMQIKESIKAPRHWPLCGEFTGGRWIPRTDGQ